MSSSPGGTAPVMCAPARPGQIPNRPSRGNWYECEVLRRAPCVSYRLDTIVMVGRTSCLIVCVDTDGGGVRRAYKFRLRPTARQHVALGQCLASHRELYNAALQERRVAWRLTRTAVFYGDQSAQLKGIRKDRPDVAAWSFSSQQATLRRLDRAFAGFFRRVKAGASPGYPRFKSARRLDSVEWPKDGDGCRWQPDTARVYLQGIGQVKVTVHRQVEGRVKTIQVRREGRRWMLVLSCADVPTRPLEPTQAAVGIDVGSPASPPPPTPSICPTLVTGGSPPPRSAPPNRSWPASREVRTIANVPETHLRPATATSPTSVATSTTMWHGYSSPTTTCWSSRISESAIWCGERHPAPTLTGRAGSCPMGPPPRPA
jgi:hypothetical protein